MIVTPWTSATWPGWVSSQFPPCSAAISTMTLPVFIDSTMSAVMSFGAGLPGMSAVVMMMSTSVACLAKSAISALMNSGLMTFA